MKNILRRFAGIFRFFGLWVGIGGTYALLANTCPCCGRASCPVGLGIAAFFGALGSFLILKGKTFIQRLLWWLHKNG
ncbi:hypothetical protein HPY86_05015 [candidate division WOR-3 bacterium]|nr:hypothetical protein [candidate division WOR-3 bacterium]